LWRYPIIITVLAFFSLAGSATPGLFATAVYAVAVAAGAVLGWFSAQHIELTLDDKTGTIMSQPTLWGTLMTAGAFVARSLADSLMKSGSGAFPGQHTIAIGGAADAALIFVAARGLASTYHMWIRTRLLLEQQIPAKEAD
jgi:hypothetical protein